MLTTAVLTDTTPDAEIRLKLARLINAYEDGIEAMAYTRLTRESLIADLLDSLKDWQADLGGDSSDAVPG